MKIKTKSKKKKIKGGASFYEPIERKSFNKLRKNQTKKNSFMTKGINYCKKI